MTPLLPYLVHAENYCFFHKRLEHIQFSSRKDVFQDNQKHQLSRKATSETTSTQQGTCVVRSPVMVKHVFNLKRQRRADPYELEDSLIYTESSRTCLNNNNNYYYFYYYHYYITNPSVVIYQQGL